MESTHQAQIPLKHLSSQAEHAEIFPKLHSSLISIGQLCDDECIVTFDNHKVIVIVSKKKDIILEGYQEPTNGLLRFPLHHLANCGIVPRNREGKCFCSDVEFPVGHTHSPNKIFNVINTLLMWLSCKGDRAAPQDGTF